MVIHTLHAEARKLYVADVEKKLPNPMTPKACSYDENCFHCKLPHAVTSRSCLKYLEEKKILLIHHRDKIPLPEARRMAASQRLHRNQIESPSPSILTRRASADAIISPSLITIKPQPVTNL